MTAPPPPPETAPAATVAVLRDGGTGLEVLLLHKQAGHAFGGMWVFPGGRTDPDEGPPEACEEVRARHTAARETHEEAGLLLHPDGLVALAHWTPPPEAPRRFATWFFIAPAPLGGTDVRVDGTEVTDHTWVAPAVALAHHGRGELLLATATWMTLHGLAESDASADALRAARSRTPERFVTRLASVNGTKVALWAGDAGYDDGNPDRPGGRHRLVMAARGGWTYERATAVE